MFGYKVWNVDHSHWIDNPSNKKLNLSYRQSHRVPFMRLVLHSVSHIGLGQKISVNVTAKFEIVKKNELKYFSGGSPSSRSRCHKAYQCHPGPAAKVFSNNLKIIFIWIVLHLGNQPGVWRWRGNGGAARRRTGRHSLLIQAMLNIIYLIKHTTFKHSQFYAISWTFKRLHKDNGWLPNWYWH